MSQADELGASGAPLLSPALAMANALAAAAQAGQHRREAGRGEARGEEAGHRTVAKMCATLACGTPRRPFDVVPTIGDCPRGRCDSAAALPSPHVRVALWAVVLPALLVAARPRPGARVRASRAV